MRILAHKGKGRTGEQVPDDNVHADLEYGESSTDVVSFEVDHKLHP